jgi:hypothetical protein
MNIVFTVVDTRELPFRAGRGGFAAARKASDRPDSRSSAVAASTAPPLFVAGASENGTLRRPLA